MVIFFSLLLSFQLHADLKASIKSDSYFYKNKRKETFFDLHLIQEERFDKNTQFYSDLYIRHWQGDRAQRTYFYPQKFYIAEKQKNTTIYLGTKDLHLSYIDFLSPTQFYQTHDMSQLLSPVTLNPLVMGFKSKFDVGTIEAYYMPVRKPSILPHEQSPWLPQKVYNDSSRVLYMPDEIHYSFARRMNYGHTDQNNILLAGTLNVETIDWRVMYYNGISSTPQITPVVTGQMIQGANPTIMRVDPDIELNVSDPRTESLGSAMQWVFGRNILRLENAWNRRYYRLKGAKEEQENALQLERLISFFNHGQGGIQVTYFWNNDDLMASPSPFSIRQVINRSIMVAGKFLWKENHDFTIYNLASTMNSGNYLMGAQYKYSFLQQWQVWAGGQLIGGKGQNLFNSFKDMSNVSFGLEWSH